MEKKYYSAKFKRDYVAISAVVIFFLIVASELVLAVSIPLYVRRENVLALSVRKLDLISDFDALRNQLRAIKTKNDFVAAETELLLWNLNRNADYLREYAASLNSDELEKMQDYQKRTATALYQLRQGKPFSQAVKLDCSPVLDSLIKQSGVEKK